MCREARQKPQPAESDQHADQIPLQIGRSHKICCETLVLASAVSDFNGKSAPSSVYKPFIPLGDSSGDREWIDPTVALELVAEQ